MDEELNNDVVDYPLLRAALEATKSFAFKTAGGKFAFYAVDENTLICVGLEDMSDESFTVWKPLHLIAGDKSQHEFEFIEDCLNTGVWVICDWKDTVNVEHQSEK